ncbi:MAG TPA: hypothetical protein VFU99_02955 [Gaiellaceae bacterium]|nr:hypothetical protein [Gaiellaceae bacterium]
MTQSPTEAVVEPARDHPRALPGERATRAEGARLDWKDFAAAYFPGRRRHHLEAIVAYGAYRRTGVVDRPASGTAGSEHSAPPTTRRGRIDVWEDEGGAST